MTAPGWSLRNIYLYAVCLITLMLTIVGAAQAVRNVVELVIPAREAEYFYEKPVTAPPTQAVSEQERAEQERAARAREVRYTVLNLVGNLAMVFIAGPLYLYHWRKVESEHVRARLAEAQAGP